jgi:cytochrome c oxidase subunit 2
VPAPRLGGLFGRSVRLADGRTVAADEEYLRESILDPNAKIVAGYPSPSVMPAFRGQLKERDVIRLIEFIKSLKDNEPEEVGP